MSFDAKEVGRFDKSGRTKVVFQVFENKGKNYIDFREMHLIEDGTLTPTYKGLTILVDKVKDMKEALQALREEGAEGASFTDKEFSVGEDKVIIKESSFKGKRFIDIRRYYKDDVGEYKPTKKGFTIPLDKFVQFVDAAVALEV